MIPGNYIIFTYFHHAMKNTVKIQKFTVSKPIISAENLWDSVLNEESEIKLTENQEIELDKQLDTFNTDHNAGSA